MAFHRPEQEPTPEDDFDRKLLDDIARHGWHMISVEADESGPGFAYSIGLYRTFDHPEILIIGLDGEVMFGMINGIGEAIRDRKKRFAHLDESDDVLEDYLVAFCNVSPKHYRDHVSYARWYYGGDDFPLLQCVWPDSAHRYPWHLDFPEALAERQPILDPDPTWRFHEGKNRMTFTTRRVLAGSPILQVCHDHDGDWQFLCGTPTPPSEGALVTLGSMVARDDSLSLVAELPEGWMAERSTIEGPWTRSKMEEPADGLEE